MRNETITTFRTDGFDGIQPDRRKICGVERDWKTGILFCTCQDRTDPFPCKHLKYVRAQLLKEWRC